MEAKTDSLTTTLPCSNSHTYNATDWTFDIENVNQMCKDLTHEDGIAFIMIAGDLAEAYPIVEIDESSPQVGRLPGFRPAQVHDMIESMADCPSDIPLLVMDGNHDIGNTAFMKHAWMGYEKQFGQLWYHFIVSYSGICGIGASNLIFSDRQSMLYCN